jgi:BCD family chlorophyll transporter-like MFS transporter
MQINPTVTSIPEIKEKDNSLGWFGIIRLGLVQTSIGAIVVMTTSTLNRIMVVELALPALIPGLLVALHYIVQMIRPRMGFASDQGHAKTPWILGGMFVLGLGGIGASIGTALMGSYFTLGLFISVVAFSLIGVGVSIGGTSLLALLAKSVNDQKRAAAATIVWIMMIFGFAITSVMIGKFIDPYSPMKVITIAGVVSIVAILISSIALYRLESGIQNYFKRTQELAQDKMPFKEAFNALWQDPDIRHFTKFIFISMLAFSSQDLILEPFAGIVFQYTVGQTTSLSGIQHSGVLLGMILVALAGSTSLRKNFGSLNQWIVYGCLASAIAMLGLAIAGVFGIGWPLQLNVFLLGVANGAFSIAAIGSMMRLAVADGVGKEGVRIGLWGGAQAIAFGLGGLLGAVASDITKVLMTEIASAYSIVFAIEAALFIVAMRYAMGIKK